MRTGPNTGIVAIAPVDQVMPTFLACAGMIGDFIGGQSGSACQFLSRLIESCRQVFTGNLQLPIFVQQRVRRLRLNGQLVQRQMIGAEGQRLFQLIAP